jgi:chromosomal replication initiation ATPase DnaA
MNLHITHPTVRKVIEQCEQQVRELTGNPSVAISFIDAEKTISFDQIAKEVCEVMNVRMERLAGPSRKTEYVQARQLISYYARKFTKMCLREIGEKFGDRDHTTIISNINRLNDLIDSGDVEMCNLVNKINRRLREVIDEQE